MISVQYKTITFDLDEGVGILHLNRPPSNVMTMDFFREFYEVITEIHLSLETKALVISGKGRHYSSGTDLQDLKKEILRQDTTRARYAKTETPEFINLNYQVFNRLEHSPIPVISSITGICLGSAFELALSSHFRFCSPEAVFGLPETTFNLIPGLGGIPKMKALTGMARTIELVLQGKTFSSEEALSYNLADKIIAKKLLLKQSILFARSISSGYRKEKHILYLKTFFKI